MNIISNNCVGGFLYNKMNEKYKNPFIWMRITGESLKTLITQYDKIDFKKYELQKDENWNMYIIIDGKVKIHYSHYKFDKVYDKPTKVNDCIKYNKIWEYVVEKYEKHISNMSEEPYFVIDAWDGMYNDDKEQFKEKSTKEFLLELLKNDFLHKTIIIHPYKDLLTSKENVYLIYDKVIEGQWSDTHGIVDRHYKEIMEIIND